MAPARTRGLKVSNENDENSISATTRTTRAKAAAGPAEDVPVKKALASKKNATGTVAARGTRRALGDMTNTSKGNAAEQENKQVAAGKAGVKPTVNGGIKKITKTDPTRTALGAKDNNAKPSRTSSTKVPAGGSGVSKKRPQSEIEDEAKEDSPEVEQRPRKVSKAKIDVDKPQLEPEDAEYDEQAMFRAKLMDGMDAEDLEDPSMCAEYVREIFEYYNSLENSTRPNPQYMDHQDDLEWKMRGILVDWLIEVHMRFRLLPETLFLAVNIIDRFLSSKVVPLDKLQLVGITAMFIASKYEEVLSPHVGNFTHVADDSFTVDEVLAAERYTLSTLNYDLSYPNPMNFLRRISKADNYDIQTRTLGKYFMELSLVDNRFLEFKQSHIAAASMYLARNILDRGPWDVTLESFSGYNEEEILPVFNIMVDFLQSPVSHEALFKKYASKKFLKASIMARKWAKEYTAHQRNGSVAVDDVPKQ